MARRLPSTVVALGVVSLLTDLSSEMIYPLLPAFLIGVLGTGAVALGTIEGVAEATASLLKIGSGLRTDRTGKRKGLITAGYALSGIARPLIGFATMWPVVAGFRFLDRIGKGLRTSPRDALIADSVDPLDRGRAYGFHRAMDHAGSVLGPLVAAGLIWWAGFEIRQVIWAAAIPGVLVLGVLMFRVKEGAVTPLPAETSERQSLPRSYSSLLIAVGVFTLGNSTDAFFLLRFTESGIPVAWVAVLWAAHSAMKMVSTWAGGRLTDRIGRRPLVLAGWLLYAAIYAGFGALETPPVLIALFLVYGITFGLTEPAERAWVADLAPGGKRGSAFGWYHGVVGIAALPASVGFGIVYDRQGPAAAFSLGAGLALIASALLMRVPKA